MTQSTADVWLLEGFNDPVHGAQETFRAVLHAMSAPGQVVALPSPNERPDGISDAATAFLLTLADYTTPIWLDPALARKDVQAYLGFHTGAPITDARADAIFALLQGTEDHLSLNEFSIGTAEYPDRAATLVIEVETLTAPATVRLTGPGIETESMVGIGPCAPGLWEALIKNNALFPLGIDVVFSAPSGVLAVPRSTQIEVL
jgi:alpha-D-ribose 1-methylphosphonate 5-triphosphate synthase subunit PhnH